MTKKPFYIGVVSKVEADGVAVGFPDERVTTVIPLVQFASKGVRIAAPVRPGDPVIVLTPDGNPDNGFALRGLFSTDMPMPAGENEMRIEVEDGTVITMDVTSGKMTVTQNSGLELVLDGGKAMLKGDLEVDGKITATGDVSSDGDVRDGAGELSRLRENYNTATYIGNMGSPTSTTQKVDE